MDQIAGLEMIRDTSNQGRRDLYIKSCITLAKLSRCEQRNHLVMMKFTGKSHASLGFV